MPFHDLEYQDSDDFVDALYRRTEELYGVDDLITDEEGLVEAAILPLRGVIIYPQMVSPNFMKFSLIGVKITAISISLKTLEFSNC